MLRSEDTTYFTPVPYLLPICIMLITLLGAGVFSAKAQISPQGAIEIEPGGQLWIEGKTSIVNYTCEAERLSGNGNIENTENPQQNVKGHGAVSVSVEVPVHSLECGKKGMNKDMYEALKADQFKNISYQLLTANLSDSLSTIRDEEGEWMNIKTVGILEIAGVKETTEVYVKGRVLGEERFRVKGNKQINMKTYNIKPPTALLGLIKASSNLTVHFDVTVRLKDV
ncbi:MAG: YceI family protein [Balneolaceae bacterium]|nr:YceI family protein [Balneolaceae bacterium]